MTSKEGNKPKPKLDRGPHLEFDSFAKFVEDYTGNKFAMQTALYLAAGKAMPLEPKIPIPIQSPWPRDYEYVGGDGKKYNLVLRMTCSKKPRAQYFYKNDDGYVEELIPILCEDICSQKMYHCVSYNTDERGLVSVPTPAFVTCFSVSYPIVLIYVVESCSWRTDQVQG